MQAKQKNLLFNMKNYTKKFKLPIDLIRGKKMRKYFGTDGIRGRAYDFLTYDLAVLVGQSLQVLGAKSLVIARDTRESGAMLVDGIIKGARSIGMNISDIGIAPTPMLAYCSARLGFIGIMVTASHNAYYDNGIKIFNKGHKLSLEEEALIEKVLNGEVNVEEKAGHTVVQKPLNTMLIYNELFTGIYPQSTLSIGLDLANGAACRTAKEIFSKVSSNVRCIGDQPDGRNINHQVGSTHLNAIQRLVKEESLDIGFAFDGDGDRLLAVDNEGTIYDGDVLIYIIANYLKKNNLLKDNRVVLTKMSNLGVLKAFREKGIDYILTDIGDKYVIDALIKNNLSIGGENSGHIINMNLLNTGDGVLNAVYLIKILTEENKTLRGLSSGITMFPDKTINIKVVDKSLACHTDVTALVDRYNKKFGDDGRVLVRASGTEPVIRITVSCLDENEVDSILNEIASVISGLS